MNLNKILITSFLILMISTYQTDSGIIFSLLLKVLLLKGALFMTMPLSIGAFMMGQGMGFFAGNMAGGYMMLRAANRYHYKEKSKWTTGDYGGGGGGGSVGGYGHHHGGWGGWNSHKFHNAYDKGKDIGSALHALAAHKTKLASAFDKVKTLLGRHKAPPKGWGWGHGGYSHSPASYGGEDDHDSGYQYASHSKYKPVTTKYGSHTNFDPYGHLKSGGPTYRPKGYGSSGGYPSSSSDYDETIQKGNLNYQNFYPAVAVHEGSGSSSYSQTSQDPSNTYYTSAYDGPGHEYTGMLTNAEMLDTYLQSAQEKSSSEDEVYVTPKPTIPSINEASTIPPNPILEKYLEQRLQEEAAKQKSTEQQYEAQQLIQMLRKAYLKQLVDSLKEEEKVAVPTSAENSRGSRSIEDSGMKNDIIQRLLSYKFSKTGSSQEDKIERADHNIFDENGIESSSRSINDTQDSTTTSTEAPSTSSESSAIISSTNKILDDEDTNGQEEASDPTEENNVSSTEKSINDFFGMNDFVQMPAMWVKVENTFIDETQPFAIRVRRGAESSLNKATPQVTESAKVPSMADSEAQVASFVDDIKKFFTLLTVLDQDQCLQKLVCDVHTNQKDASTLTQYEQNILTTFRLMKALMPEGDEDSTTKYRRAALIGETGQSLELCQQTYNGCGFSSSQIISLGSEAEATASDWADAGAMAARSDYVTMPRVRRNLRSFYL